MSPLMLEEMQQSPVSYQNIPEMFWQSNDDRSIVDRLQDDEQDRKAGT